MIDITKVKKGKECRLRNGTIVTFEGSIGNDHIAGGNYYTSYGKFLHSWECNHPLDIVEILDIEKYVISIDQSINGTGLTISTISNTLELKIVKSYFFTSTKKYTSDVFNNIKSIYIDTKQSKSKYHKYFDTIQAIVSVIPPLDEVSIVLFESNALDGKGLIVDISEFTGALKYAILSKGYTIEQFEPTTIKTVVTKGNAGKPAVELGLIEKYPDIYNHLFGDVNVSWMKSGESPKADIIDSVILVLYYYNQLMKHIK